MKNYFKKFKSRDKGAVALILIIMITTLTLVSSVVISLVNISDLMANYHLSEAEETMVDIDACIDDVMHRISSSTDVSGSFSLSTSVVNCSSSIATTVDWFKWATSTATSSSDVGFWSKSIAFKVNVSTSPISIDVYKDNLQGFASNAFCGDGTCQSNEDCGTCEDDCGACVCGDGSKDGAEACDDGDTDTEACGDGTQDNGTFCNSDCTLEYDLDETCDDGNVYTEFCGDAIHQSGASYCNATCTATYAGGEECDANFYGSNCDVPWNDYYLTSYTHSEGVCTNAKLTGIACKDDCTACTSICVAPP